MKSRKVYIQLAAVMGLVIFLYAFTNERNSKRKLTLVDVQFVNSENLFITYPTVNKLLIQNKDTVTNIAKEKLVLNKLEETLNANQMIRDAQVYLTVNGKLGAKIRQRTPIARVKGKHMYYLDSEGESMPLSSVFSARVPLITGAVSENNLPEVYKLAKYIWNDVFLKQNVIGIQVKKNHFELLLRKDNFKVIVGKSDHLTHKFRNFKAFYQKAQKDGSINQYKQVSLQFDNQVVCTKK